MEYIHKQASIPNMTSINISLHKSGGYSIKYWCKKISYHTITQFIISFNLSLLKKLFSFYNPFFSFVLYYTIMLYSFNCYYSSKIKKNSPFNLTNIIKKSLNRCQK